jgi:hypothetical protein
MLSATDDEESDANDAEGSTTNPGLATMWQLPADVQQQTELGECIGALGNIQMRPRQDHNDNFGGRLDDQSRSMV